PPSIHILPPNGQVTVRRGGPVSFECRASGNPAPVVQWSKKVIYILYSNLFTSTGETYFLVKKLIKRES
ncbi:hypothetical protein HHI36_013410, partial [Cryptolaemus montrouzieri]